MQLTQQILFILLTVVAIIVFAKKCKEIYGNINLGKDENLSDNAGKRWKNVLLLALGQKKMFRYPL
ncbi:MAG: Fe-S oxidoreductase, partial [Ginsengibacter sp.]